MTNDHTQALLTIDAIHVAELVLQQQLADAQRLNDAITKFASSHGGAIEAKRLKHQLMLHNPEQAQEFATLLGIE